MTQAKKLARRVPHHGKRDEQVCNSFPIQSMIVLVSIVISGRIYLNLEISSRDEIPLIPVACVGRICLKSRKLLRVSSRSSHSTRAASWTMYIRDAFPSDVDKHPLDLNVREDVSGSCAQSGGNS